MRTWPALRMHLPPAQAPIYIACFVLVWPTYSRELFLQFVGCKKLTASIASSGDVLWLGANLAKSIADGFQVRFRRTPIFEIDGVGFSRRAAINNGPRRALNMISEAVLMEPDSNLVNCPFCEVCASK